MDFSNNELSQIESQIKQLDPNDFLNYLALVSCYDKNEQYHELLEFLFKFTLTISENQFKREPLDIEKMISLFALIRSKVNMSKFDDSELNLSKDYLPIWIMGRRYRLPLAFKGRIYQYWKSLATYYFPVKDLILSTFKFDPMYLIEQILKVNNSIVDLVDDGERDPVVIGGIHLLDTNLVNIWKQITREWINDLKYKEIFLNHRISLGQFGPNYISCNNLKVFEFFLIEASGEYILSIPYFMIVPTQRILEQTTTNGDIYYYSNLQVKSKIRRIISRFMRTNEIGRVSINGSEPYEFSLFQDRDKLYVFDIVDFHTLKENVIDITNNVIKFQNVANNRGKNVLTDSDTGARIPNTNEHIITYFTIIITTKIDLGFSCDLSFSDNHLIMHYYDFFTFFKLLQDPYHLCKFIKALNELKLNKIQNHELLSLISYYLFNNDSFEYLEKTIFNSNSLRFIYRDLLDEVWKDSVDFQPRFSSKEGDDHWNISVINEDLLFADADITGDTAYIVKTPYKQYWIMTTVTEFKYTTAEIQSLILMAEMLAHHFKHPSLVDFLTKTLGDNEIRFVLHPDTHLASKGFSIPSKDQLRVRIIKTSTTNPIHVHIYYSLQRISSNFLNDPLSAEKGIFRELLNSIHSNHISSKFEATTPSLIISKVLKNLFENYKPGFNVHIINQSEIPRMDLNPEVLKIYQADVSLYQKIISTYLRKNNFNPGIYSDDGAKKIINSIVSFLLSILRRNLEKYDSADLLILANENLSQILQKKYQNTQIVLDNHEKIKLYDPISKYNQENKELLDLYLSNQFLIENFPHSQNSGTDLISVEKYTEIQALCQTLINLIIVSDHIHHRTQGFNLVIHRNYQHDLVPTESGIDAHYYKHIENKIFDSFQNKPFDFNQINEPFKDEFGIDFVQFTNLLKICSTIPNRRNERIECIDEESLIILLMQESSYEKDKIVQFLLCFRFNIWDKEYFPTDRRNRKNRIVILPLIYVTKSKFYILNSWLIQNAKVIWENEIITGFLPYNDDHINSELLKSKLKEIRRKSNRDFETTVEDFIKKKTHLCEFRVKENKRCFRNLPERCPGEIDSLVINPGRKEVYLIDEKDSQIAGVPSEMHSHTDKYSEEDGYIDKINKKKNYIEKYLESILEYFKIKKEGEWNIICMFVTSNVSFLKLGHVIVLSVSEFNRFLEDRI